MRKIKREQYLEMNGDYFDQLGLTPDERDQYYKRFVSKGRVRVGKLRKELKYQHKL